MNFMTISKSVILAAVCCCSFALTSCDNDDDSGKSMKLNATKVVLGVGATQTVTASNCTTPLTAKSAAESVATATVDKSTITVKGVAAGSTTVVVTDNAKQTATIAVTVNEVLSFDKTSLEVEANKEGVINVTSGTAPYTAAVKDKTIASATVTDKTITIKGLKAGKTTITITDNKKVTGSIAVTVK